jgi:hypothetical protein
MEKQSALTWKIRKTGEGPKKKAKKGGKAGEKSTKSPKRKKTRKAESEKKGVYLIFTALLFFLILSLNLSAL